MKKERESVVTKVGNSEAREKRYHSMMNEAVAKLGIKSIIQKMTFFYCKNHQMKF